MNTIDRIFMIAFFTIILIAMAALYYNLENDINDTVDTITQNCNIAHGTE